MGKAMGAATALAALLAAGAARAAGPVEDEITSLETKWTNANTAHDRAFLEAVMAPDWRGESERGAVDRAKSIDETLKSKDHIVSAVNRDVHVMVAGDIAVAQGLEDDAGTRAGKPYKKTYIWTDVFQRRDGKWVAVRSQNAVMKKTAKTS